MLTKFDIYSSIAETQLLNSMSTPVVDFVPNFQPLSTSFFNSPKRILVVCKVQAVKIVCICLINIDKYHTIFVILISLMYETIVP